MGGAGGQALCPQSWPSHGLELVDALLRVALPDLPQRLVLVAALPHVLVVDDVIVCPLVLVSGLGQLTAQGLGGEEGWSASGVPERGSLCPPAVPPDPARAHQQLPLHTLVLLGLGEALLLIAVI